jgi:phospho-N-acetylmuramoyl-pentapeptide-transferase
VGIVGLVGGWWFFAKLGVTSIFIPTLGALNLGALFIPVFIIFMIGLYSGGIIDGVDGLAGGVFSIMYAAFATIAFYNNQIDIAAFCMAISGGLLAFLWFNIPPARFFLSETGTMGLTTTLVVVAFLTDSVFVLPIIALPLIVTTLSSLIQILSKKYRGKKVFLVAPLHNHFQAMGWPAAKVTMRYWVISMLSAITGVIIILLK